MTKYISRFLFPALAALVVLSLAGCAATSSQTSTDSGTTTQQPTQEEAPATSGTPTEDVTELKVEDLVVGTGAEAKTGDLVTVHYTGWLTDGTTFDSSVDRGQPFSFTIGEGRVIPGWEQGVAGMKVGGKRRLTIPPDLAYGDAGAGNGAIPPGATLVFDVELLNVQ